MMQTKQYLFTVLFLGILFLSSCDNNASLVGGMLTPDEDKMTLYSDTFMIQASTVKRDSLFAKSTTGLVGEYFDPLYGRLKADFLCQFYCVDEFEFYKPVHKGVIDSIYLALYYLESGDPNSPFQFQVFPVNKPLDKVYYTDINPADYCDLQTIWGQQVFTAANCTIIDSIQISSNDYVYYRRLEILLPFELGQKFYDETVNNPGSFKNQQAFNDFFPGIYVTTGYGSGCLFDVQRTDIFIDYKFCEISSTGEDSIVVWTERFITTKEVIQLNRFENSDTEQLLVDNDDYTFVKTPAGIYTRLVIPTQEIKEVIEGRLINNMVLSFKYMPNENWPYSLNPPNFLLLLHEDSLVSFFQNRYVENGITSFLSSNSEDAGSISPSVGYSSTYRTYYFNNVAYMLSYYLSAAPDEDLRLLLVPVSRKYSATSNGAYYSTEISNFLAPSGVKLRKDNDLLKFTVVTSKFNNK